MSFKVKANPSFIAPIQINAPGGDVQTLTVTFRHQRAKEAAEWLKRSDGETRQAALLEVIEAWDATDFPFSGANLDELLQEQPGAGQALVVGYWGALHGAVRKN